MVDLHQGTLLQNEKNALQDGNFNNEFDSKLNLFALPCQWGYRIWPLVMTKCLNLTKGCYPLRISIMNSHQVFDE